MWRRKLNPLPQGLVKLYGVIAVLLVIIPEFLAEWLIAASNLNYKNDLQMEDPKWEDLPELTLASMSLKELRILAKRLQVHGYSSDSKKALYERLLRRLSHMPKKLISRICNGL